MGDNTEIFFFFLGFADFTRFTGGPFLEMTTLGEVGLCIALVARFLTRGGLVVGPNISARLSSGVAINNLRVFSLSRIGEPEGDIDFIYYSYVLKSSVPSILLFDDNLPIVQLLARYILWKAAFFSRSMCLSRIEKVNNKGERRRFSAFIRIKANEKRRL